MWKRLQKIVSRTEPELGLGSVVEVKDEGFVVVHFKRSEESRQYSVRSAPLLRFRLRAGQKAMLPSGDVVEIQDAVEEEETDLILYHYEGGTVWEYDLEDQVQDQGALEQFFSGELTHHRTYDLRRDARNIRAAREGSGIQGLVGPRVTSLAHQLYIAEQVSRRLYPRVLLADEVGLGKTIEAGLIFSALKFLGRAEKVLVVVPSSLVHQWVAEMYRRFYQLFSVVDEDRCQEEWASQNMSVFDANTHLIVSLDFLMDHPERCEEALGVDWDLVIIDEAHHLRWDEEEPEARWLVSQSLAKKSKGLLLLTAIPQQYGFMTQFGLLHLVDPERFDDFDAFLREQDKHGAIADVVKTIKSGDLSSEVRKVLVDLFADDQEVVGFLNQPSGDHEQLLRMLIDRHGSGRVLFRNRRERLKGFPERKLHSIPLKPNEKVVERIKGIDELDEMILMDLATGRWNERISQLTLKDHPKISWLKKFLDEDHEGKVLVLCGSAQGVLQVGEALAEASFKTGLFHEGLSVVERDQQVAWFADPDGAKVLVCSEIGGEGRNFQFASSLIFLDLPRHPDLVEQRVGRLDRIGQRKTVQIYVPWIEGTPEEALFRWYHDGLNSFESSWNGAAVILDEFVDDLFLAFGAFVPGAEEFDRRQQILEKLVDDSRDFSKEVRKKNQNSVDVLIDMNSYDETKGMELLERVEDVDDDPSVEFFMRSFFDHFGVDYEDYDDRGSLVVRPDSLSFVEKLPGLSGLDETLMTFDRDIALKREDMIFLTRDHGIVDECLSFLLDRNEGVASVCKWPDSPIGVGMIVEISVILSPLGPRSLELDRFMNTESYEISFNHKGKKSREKRHKNEPHLLVELSRDEISVDQLKNLVEPVVAKSLEKARRWADEKVATSLQSAEQYLGSELARLRQLETVNPLIRPDEIAALEGRMVETKECLERTQPRIDGIRLIFTT